MKRINITGNRYGRLIVIEYSSTINGHAHWKCKCDCGNTSIHSGANLKSGQIVSCGCRRNEILKGKVGQITFEEVRDIFESNGLSLLTNEYINIHSKILCLNKDGYKVVPTLSNIKEGKTPLVFSKSNPYTIENITFFLDKNNIPYQLISKEFQTACKHKMEWKCDKGHVFEMSWNSISQGRGCSVCAGNQKKTHEQFVEEVREIVSTEYQVLEKYINADTKIKMKHNKCGHIYKVTPSHFLDTGRRCPKCAIKSGPDSPSYNPNITDEEREKRRTLYKKELDEWRNEVFARDDYTCQCCNERGGTIHAHHLDGYHWCKDKRFDVDNGATLCERCHTTFHRIYGTRNNTKQQFIEFLTIIHA